MRPITQRRAAHIFVLVTELDSRLGRRWRTRDATDTAGRLVAAFDALDDFELLLVDGRARSYFSPLSPSTTLGGLESHRDPSIDGALMRLNTLAPSGFVRQRALRAVGEAGAPVLPALALIRATDWVDEVCGDALRILEDLSPDDLVVHLPLADHLSVNRHRGATLAALVARGLAGQRGLRALREARAHPDRLVRRSCWRRSIEVRSPQRPEDISEALDDHDLVVRRLAAEEISKLEPDHQAELAARLRGDSVGQLRALGLTLEIHLGRAGREEVKAALRDRAAAVRSLAQFHWRSLGESPIEVYRGGDLNTATARDVTGAGETGTIADVPWVYAQLESDDDRVQAAALRALTKLDPAVGRAAEQMLDSPSPAVVSAALKAVRRSRLDDVTLSRCAARALGDHRPRVRQSSLGALRASTWLSLETTLLLLEAPNQAVSDQARHEVRAWLKRSASVTTGPSAEQRERIEALLFKLNPDARREVQFVLRTSA